MATKEKIVTLTQLGIAKSYIDTNNNNKTDKVDETSCKADQIFVDDGSGNIKGYGMTIEEVLAEHTATDDEFRTEFGIAVS